MVNYLALLGWNDGTEEEIFTRKQLGKSEEGAFPVLPQVYATTL